MKNPWFFFASLQVLKSNVCPMFAGKNGNISPMTSQSLVSNSLPLVVPDHHLKLPRQGRLHLGTETGLECLMSDEAATRLSNDDGQIGSFHLFGGCHFVENAMLRCHCLYKIMRIINSSQFKSHLCSKVDFIVYWILHKEYQIPSLSLEA